MGTLVFENYPKKCLIYLNISFLIVLCFYSSIHFFFLESVLSKSYSNTLLDDHHTTHQGCKGLSVLDDYKAKCVYLKTHRPCISQGYLDYLYLSYCTFGKLPFLSYLLMFFWLLVLFYLLGSTASQYFCPSLESLSRLLNLSPTIAGVTLLSLGNGAPDVFTSLISFMGSGTCEVGLNTILGGASFVSCVVIGIISIVIFRRVIRVNKLDFVRDVCFFLLVLASLVLVLLIGEIDIWGALAFSSLQVVYVLLVYVSHSRWKKIEVVNGDLTNGSDLDAPILQDREKKEIISMEEGILLDGNHVDELVLQGKRRRFSCGSLFLSLIEMPLYLPRRLTIPVVCEERWSKPFAVISVTFAPILLAALWNSHLGNMTSKTSLVIYGVGLCFGTIFGVLAFVTTEDSSPPKKCLFPWLSGGFLMSVVWSYLTAQELVGLLVSLGYIFQISPSILGLTILAWGNSLGDLITNLTLALKEEPEGAQIAVSGCYAGPIFNTLVGLGLSLVGSSWYVYPSTVVIPKDPYILETIGFLMGGLVWGLVILPRRDMRLDRVFGGGLLTLYLISVSFRLIPTLGSLQRDPSHT